MTLLAYNARTMPEPITWNLQSQCVLLFAQSIKEVLVKESEKFAEKETKKWSNLYFPVRYYCFFKCYIWFLLVAQLISSRDTFWRYKLSACGQTDKMFHSNVLYCGPVAAATATENGCFIALIFLKYLSKRWWKCGNSKWPDRCNWWCSPYY